MLRPIVRWSQHGTFNTFMAALWNRTGHNIFAQWFLSSSFCPRLILAVLAIFLRHFCVLIF